MKTQFKPSKGNGNHLSQVKRMKTPVNGNQT